MMWTSGPVVFSFRACVAWLALAILSACSFERPTTVLPATYDFGPPPAYSRSNAAITGTVLVPPILAPAWLDDTGIVYRLLYEDGARPQIYAMSRWAAEPASLITDRLRSRFAAASSGVVTPGFSVRSDYTLRIELEDFSQRFNAPADSRALLRARASLFGTVDRQLLAQRVFNIERPAGANAPSAVKALTEATDAFLEELVQWTAQNARAGGEEQKSAKAAKP
jgi:cholesterol transport system auxiliary component